ncbi:MAG: NFACT RNA binding domain-containing protein, partial [Candidatus Micrarchaeota archaeon]|nr:NFACT RNA binding domain-containing protein [Candidatus Micrarchaeota archaeon]
MAIVVDYRKSTQENASGYYSLSKELAKKAEGARKAIVETEAEISAAQNSLEAARAKKNEPAMRRRKEWQEKYKWFVTSGGKMVLAGRDAKQNDQLVSKMMAEDDLFFHADIQGAPATILVGGKEASGQEKNEAAQFAASHSSAWKVGAAAVDVY